MAQKQLKKSNPIKVKKVVKPSQIAERKVEFQFFTVGRRKTATARVRMGAKAGSMNVNGKTALEYFKAIDPTGVLLAHPFRVVGEEKGISFSAKVGGSGMMSQLGAVIHGLTRGLVKLNPDFKLKLRTAGLLTRDDRMKESRSIGTGGKARRRKQSPKR